MLYFEDLSIFVIAEKLNISVDAVRLQKARAINALRTIFKKDRLLLAAFMLMIHEIPA